MMALTHYNSLIKAHPAVTAALGCINTHTAIWENKSLFTHTGKYTNSLTQKPLLAGSPVKPSTTAALLIYTPTTTQRSAVGGDF